MNPERNQSCSDAGKVNPERVRVAREARGMTQKELAERIGVSQGRLSKIENAVAPSSDHVRTIARALGFPEEFFLVPGPVTARTSGCESFYRKSASVGQKAVKKINAQLSICRMQVARLVRDVEIEPTIDLPSIDPGEFDGEIAAIAHRVRSSWAIPSGPILNLIGLIEAAGVFVIARDFESTRIEAVSQRPADCPPLLFVNIGKPFDRVRWSIAHELGHLIMHSTVSAKMEREADLFAAALLMPEGDVRRDLSSISLERLRKLKEKWRVSMQALLRRARDLRTISKDQYRRWMIEFSRLGYRRVEPHPVQRELPKLLDSAVDYFRSNLGYGDDEIAKAIHCNPREFSEQYGVARRFRVLG